MNQKKKIKLIALIIIWSVILIMLASIILKVYNINLEKNTKGAKRMSSDFVLTSQVNINAANGRGGVDLDWSSYDNTNKIFKAYQKKEGASEFETISTVDFYNEIEPIKVLNVYPVYNDDGTTIPKVIYRYLDGKIEDIPKSASLKVWMEGGTMTENSVTTSFEAYGKNPKTGQQIIKITPISSIEFNNKPDKIWDYDVVMFGIWDWNGNETDQPNEDSLKVIEEYIKEGYGILAGHDSIMYTQQKTGHNALSKLRKYFNIEIGYTDSYISDRNKTDYNTRWAYASTYIIVKKNGILTNFPYELRLGTKLKIPETHTFSNAAKGNVWMEFIDGSDGIGDQNYQISNYNGKGSPIYYLTTWNNTAMIQTGHSNCESTDDERKILANTLFYLKQRTTATAFTDNSAQDLKAPDAPTTKMERVDDSNLQVTLNAEDKGSEYVYYIEALDANNAENVIATSNQITETVTTGTKGYYYVIDNSKTNTNFDIERGTYTESANVNINMSNVRKIYTCKSNRWSRKCK